LAITQGQTMISTPVSSSTPTPRASSKWTMTSSITLTQWSVQCGRRTKRNSSTPPSNTIKTQKNQRKMNKTSSSVIVSTTRTVIDTGPLLFPKPDVYPFHPNSILPLPTNP
jgi:hypothetical protein